MLAVDQAADQRDLAKGALQQMGALHPFDELMLQYVRRKERAGIDNRLHRPRAKRIIGGDETQWSIARRLHAASEEHAERLVRVPAFEREGDHIVCAFVREGFDQHLVRPGQQRRTEEHTSELQSLMRISYAVFCLKKKN